MNLFKQDAALSRTRSPLRHRYATLCEIIRIQTARRLLFDQFTHTLFLVESLCMQGTYLLSLFRKDLIMSTISIVKFIMNHLKVTGGCIV